MEIPPGLIDTAAILRAGGTTDALHRSFRAGLLVRIRRGFYVATEDWLGARPSERFAWTTTAVSRSVKGAVFCGQTAAVAGGLPTLGTPPCVELATTLPGRSGTRKSTLLVLGQSGAAEDVRRTRSYPLRYRLRAGVDPVRNGEYLSTGLVETAVDVLGSGELPQALVVADGAARRFAVDGVLEPGGTLLSVPGLRAGIATLPSAAGRRRAERVAALASPLPESVGESYSRAVVGSWALSSLNCSTSSATGQALLAGAISGGRGREWWGNSTGRPSTWRRRGGTESLRRRLSTGRSCVRTVSAPSAMASSAGGGPT
jgi:hypothetical protein